MARLVSIQIWVDFHLKGLGLRDRFLLPDEEAVEQEEEVVQVPGHVEDAAPLHEPHVFWVFLVAYHKADARNLLEVDHRGRQRAFGRICAAEVIFEALAQAEANAALGIVVDLDLPERDAISFESLPAVASISFHVVI